MIKRYRKKLLIVALLISTGFLLDFYGLLEPEMLLGIARGYAEHWWLVIVLILLQAVMFTFALAGSLFLWVAAPLYQPAMAAFILAAGATLGGIGAYWFSQKLTDDWIARIENSHAYKLLHKQDNFFALFALRVFPAFPHSLVNYSSGILRVKLSHFILAAFLGVGIKSYIYASVIYNAASSASLDELMNISTYGPLLLLSALSLAGLIIRHWISSRKEA
ncbi:MAG: VTT domain-containing protein [Gammaproteobacteria bacterium]|nr:VTT domain-containing protein [Gammaproteobacteria bacterium]